MTKSVRKGKLEETSGGKTWDSRVKVRFKVSIELGRGDSSFR
jgi:hypothetical protein